MKLVVLIPILFFSIVSFGQIRCQKISVALEVAKEIELDRSDSLSVLLRPQKDDLYNAVPISDREYFYGKHFPGLDLDGRKKITWDQLTFEQKNEVLVLVGKYANFDLNRQIPNFEFRTEFEFTPKNSFEFRGVKYEAGLLQKINLDKFLMPTAEYAMSWVVSTAKALEMHFRGKNPQTLDEDVRTFYNEILPYIKGLRPGHEKDYGIMIHSDHIHIPAARPVRFIERSRQKGLTENQIVDALVLHHASVELAMILMNAHLSPQNALQEIKYFPNKPATISFLTTDKAEELHSFYTRLVQNQLGFIDRSSEEGSQLKKNNLGARAGNTYSDPNLWGLEMRYLFSYKASFKYLPLAQKIKKNLDQQNFDSYAGLVSKGNVSTENTMLAKDPHEMVEHIVNPELKFLAQQLMATRGPMLVSQQRTTTSYSSEFLLLLDWAEHPLIKANPAYAKFVTQIQIETLKKSNDRNADSGFDSSVFVREFLEKTQLLDYFVAHL